MKGKVSVKNGKVIGSSNGGDLIKGIWEGYPGKATGEWIITVYKKGEEHYVIKRSGIGAEEYEVEFL